MAAADAKLIAVIEANTKQFENALKRIEKTTNAAFKGGAANVTKLDAGMRQATGSAARLDAALAKTGLSTAKLTSQISTFGKGLAAGILGGIGIAAITSLGGAIQKARDALAEFDAISKSARTTGLDPEFFQALSFGALEAGISQEKLNTALLFFAKNAGLASSGTGPLAAGLKRLNPELLKSITLATTQEERLRLVAEAMKAAGSAAERAALSATVFGRGAVDISEVLAGGAAGLDDFIRRAQELGFIIDRELLASSDALDDKLSVLSKAIELNLNQALIHLAPLLVEAAEAMNNFAKEIKGTADAIAKGDILAFMRAQGAADWEINAVAAFLKMMKNSVETIGEAKREVDDFIHALEQDVNVRALIDVNKLQRTMILLERLSRLLQVGTPAAAKEAEDALKELVDSNYRFDALANKIQPVIDKLKEGVTATGELNEALGKLSASDFARAFGGEQATKTQAFIEAQKLEASKTSFQQELDRETDNVLEAAEKVGLALTRAAAEIIASGNIRARETVQSIDQAVGSFVGDIVQAEAPQGGPNLAGASTAFGVGQFIESTWLDLFKKHFPEQAAGMSRESILALRADRAISEALIEDYARENAAVLQKAGVTVTDAALQLSHFLGAGDAAKVLNAAPGTPLAGLIDPDSIAANPTILGGGKTVDDAILFAQNRVGGSRSVAAQEMDKETAALKKLNEAKADFEAQLKAEGEAINLEISNIGKSTAAAEYAAVKQDLLNQLTAAGIPLTKEYAAAIEDIANASAARVTAGEIFAENEKQNQDAMQETVARADAIRDLASDVLGGLASDLANGVKPAEALANALGKIAQKLIDIGVNAVVSGLFGPTGTSLGGLLGGGGTAVSSQALSAISGGVVGGIFHQGGVVGAGGPSRMVPASAFIGAPRYHSGGVAGFRPGEMPAILQKGELIIPKLRALGRGGQQRVDVHNTVEVNTSPMLVATMTSLARQAEDNAVSRTPAYMANQEHRRMGRESPRG